jgi:hypothetical protein
MTESVAFTLFTVVLLGGLGVLTAVLFAVAVLLIRRNRTTAD